MEVGAGRRAWQVRRDVNLLETKEKVQKELFEAISAQIAGATSLTAPLNRAKTLAQLALAYRYTAGGQQPGSGGTEK